MEEFRVVPLYETYEISENGIINRLPYKKHIGNGKYCMTKKYKINPYKNTETKHSYVTLYNINNNTSKKFGVHHIVAITFIQNPNNYKLVEHKDDNPENNHYSNLEWSNSSKNTLNGYYRGNAKHRVKAVFQYDLNDNFIQEFASVRLAQRHFGVKVNITDCCNGKAKTAKGFKWKYK